MPKKENIYEKSMIKARTSRKAYLPYYTMGFILIAVIAYIKSTGRPLNNIAVIATIIFILLIIKVTEVHRLSKYYEVMLAYVAFSKGFFKKDRIQIHMPTISDIVLKQTPWQRILNFGNVEIYRYTTGTPNILVKNINNPHAFIEAIESQLSIIKKHE